MADMTQVVLDRLDAFRAGDMDTVAAIDARTRKDQRTMAALFAAAFGIAGKTLDVLQSVAAPEVAITMASFRAQVNDIRGMD